MGFITAGINARTLKKQQSQLQFRQIVISNKIENITSKMNSVKSNVEYQNNIVKAWNNLDAGAQYNAVNKDGDKNKALYEKAKVICPNGQYSSLNGKNNQVRLDEVKYQNDANYIQYQIADETLDSEKESLDSQLTLINEQLKSMQSLEQSGAKEAGTLWCVGGGS